MERRRFIEHGLFGLAGGFTVGAPLIRRVPPAAGTFDLRITFTGLCMLVPDPVRRNVHVLLPSARQRDGEPMDGVPVHHPRLMWDEAYEKGESWLSRRMRCRELDGQSVGFRGLPSDGVASLDLPDEIGNVDRFVRGAGVEPKWLASNPSPALASRITLQSGCVSDCAVGAYFSVPDADEPRHMTWQVEWTVRGLREPVAVERVSLANGEVVGSTELHPIGRTVQVSIDNVPPREPTTAAESIPDVGTRALHYAAYYHVLTPHVGSHPAVPVLASHESPIESECEPATGRVADRPPVADVSGRPTSGNFLPAPPGGNLPPGNAAVRPMPAIDPHKCMVAQAVLLLMMEDAERDSADAVARDTAR